MTSPGPCLHERPQQVDEPGETVGVVAADDRSAVGPAGQWVEGPVAAVDDIQVEVLGP